MWLDIYSWVQWFEMIMSVYFSFLYIDFIVEYLFFDMIYFKQKIQPLITKKLIKKGWSVKLSTKLCFLSENGLQ